MKNFILAIFVSFWSLSSVIAQNNVEYQYVKYQTTQDFLIKWEADQEYPNVEISVSSLRS